MFPTALAKKVLYRSWKVAQLKAFVKSRDASVTVRNTGVFQASLVQCRKIEIQKAHRSI